MSRKLILQIHRWLGLVSGLVVFIVGLTGAIYAFEKELSAFFYRDIYAVTPGPQKLGMDSLYAIAHKTLGPEYPITRIWVHEEEPGRTVEFSSWKFDANAPTYWQKVKYSKSVFIDPYTGRVVKQVNLKWEFFTVVLAIHTSLLLGHTGSLLIGWSTVVFIILLISGFILWYPRNKAAARQRFWFRWKKTTSLKRRNYDWHNISGFYSLLFLLIIALTGLVWTFDWWEATVIRLVNRGREIQPSKPVYSDTTQPFTALPLSKIVRQIPAEADGRKQYFMVIPLANRNTVNVVIPGAGRKRYQFIQLYFDRFSGKLIERGRLFHEKSDGERLRNMNIDLHTGSILGFAGKLLACIVSLIAAALPVTGFLIWWVKKKKKTAPARKIAIAVPQSR